MPLIPFSPEAPLLPTKLCMKCAHYIPPKMGTTATGRGQCRLYGNVDVIDGSVTYADVRTIRQQFCKGAKYEDSPQKNT